LWGDKTLKTIRYKGGEPEKKERRGFNYPIESEKSFTMYGGI
jgi:hypothetical protein